MTTEQYEQAGKILTKIKISEEQLNKWETAVEATDVARVRNKDGYYYDARMSIPFTELKARAVDYWSRRVAELSNQLKAL